MTRPDPLWRGMTREELDAAYNNAAAVPGSAAVVAGWAERSRAFRERHGGELDVPYGPGERNRVDVFRSGVRDAPLLAFIHGGYWQRNAKEVFSCMAEGPLAHGVDVAMVGYTLAPEARLTGIVEEVRAALRMLARDRAAAGRLVASGWSAGGHLAASAMDMPEVAAGLSVSGVFDLEPCRLSYLNEKLGLTEGEARATSPIHHLPARAGPFAIAWGERELPELRRQSEDYAAAWAAAGLEATPMPMDGHDHFSILEELASPDGALARAAARLARG